MRYNNYGRAHYIQNVGTYPKPDSPSGYAARGNVQFERLPNGLWMWWINYGGDRLQGFYRGSAREVYKFVGGRLRATGGCYFVASRVV
jgi:hypothetical protein